MQLDALILYNTNGETRIIRFRPGELNIITGESKTGKSSIIDILSYLLGSGNPNVPNGPIRDTIAWYGLLAHVGGTNFFIGRPAPTSDSSVEVMLRVGQKDVPQFASLAVNTNSTDLIKYLGGIEGIEENLFVPPQGQTRRPLSANIRHALFYCFQGQVEVANPELLFHHQNLDFRKQTIRDTLPYFLGAQSTNTLAKQQLLSELRRERRNQAARLEELKAIRKFGFDNALRLIKEAHDNGLIIGNPKPENTQEALNVLRKMLDDKPPTISSEATNANEANDLLERRLYLRERLREINDHLRGLEDFANSASSYHGELEEHRSRLESIGLVPTAGSSDQPCPICHRIIDNDDSLQAINDALGQVRDRIHQVQRERPEISFAQSQLRQQRDAYQNELDSVKRALSALSTRDRIQSRIQKTWDTQNFIRGRIAQFLETIQPTDDAAAKTLTQKIAELDNKIKNLDEELDPATLRATVLATLFPVGQSMTKIAKDLDLEHAEGGVWIDPSRLTVVANTPRGLAYLDKGSIGSGMNWVGYHVATYLALQEFFISHKRPVPSFIVFDQPSQAFFPQDRSHGGDLEELSDTDRDNTLRLFKLLYDTAKKMGNRLQIIVLDHADFDEPWFRNSTIESWRDGKALIPRSWITDAESS